MSAFKLITFLFPFIKEMILGEKTIKEALKTNKMRVFLIGLILLSFFLNMFTIPKLVKISADYVILDRKYKELDERFKGLNQSAHPVAKPATEPEKKKEEPIPHETEPQYPVYEPDRPPPEDQPVPAAAPTDQKRQQQHRRQKPELSHKPRVDKNGNSPEASRRYHEWKKTLDEIRARQVEDQKREDAFYAQPGFPDNPYRH